MKGGGTVRLQKWPTKLGRHPGAMLVLLCYAVALLVFLLAHTIGLVQNRMAYAGGELAHATLTLSDFELNNEIYMREDGMLVTAGADPQLLLKDTGRRVENVTVHFEYSRAPRIRQVFWATPEKDYELRKTAYPFRDVDGAVTFLLPAAGGQSLRIDPDSIPGTEISFISVTINERRPFWQFYLPGAGEGLSMLLVPLLVGCGASLAIEAGLGLVFLRKNRDPNPFGDGEGAAPNG